jgi:hypothetical protein
MNVMAVARRSDSIRGGCHGPQICSGARDSAMKSGRPSFADSSVLKRVRPLRNEFGP